MLIARHSLRLLDVRAFPCCVHNFPNWNRFILLYAWQRVGVTHVFIVSLGLVRSPVTGELSRLFKLYQSL